MKGSINVSGLLLAGGRGERLGVVSKSRLKHQGRTLLEITINKMEPSCDELLIGVPPEEMDSASAITGSLSISPRVSLKNGGRTRQETVGKLLACAKGKFVLIHEVARPFAPDRLFEAVINAVESSGAAACFLDMRIRDTLAERDGDFLGDSIGPKAIGGIQCPQAFRSDILRKTLQEANKEGWFDRSLLPLVKRAGYPVRLVAGSEQNFKITYPEDLEATGITDAI